MANELVRSLRTLVAGVVAGLVRALDGVEDMLGFTSVTDLTAGEFILGEALGEFDGESTFFQMMKLLLSTKNINNFITSVLTLTKRVRNVA